jgi:hypothetical protein
MKPSGATSEVAVLLLKAARDLALGDFTANSSGHMASSGAEVSKEIQLTVFQT